MDMEGDMNSSQVLPLNVMWPWINHFITWNPGLFTDKIENIRHEVGMKEQ